MIRDHEEACAPPLLPASMHAEILGYDWTRNTVGESGGTVYRLFGKSGAPDLFLKHGTGTVADDLLDEVSRLRWMAGRMPVPTVKHFVSTPNQAWLLMTALPGQTAYQSLASCPENRFGIVDALARFLRHLHALPIDECPFNSDHTYKLGLARKRIDADLVDESDFDEERENWTAEQVWEAIQRQLPLATDPVVTHGDFSLDNLLMVDGGVVGCIDVGRVGIADRYQDLAILWNCLGEFGSCLQDRFLARYGLPNLDQEKMLFHLLLDELF